MDVTTSQNVRQVLPDRKIDWWTLKSFNKAKCSHVSSNFSRAAFGSTMAMLINKRPNTR
jgi:hypothetical protein